MNEGNSISQNRHTITADIDKNLNLIGAAEELHSAFGNLVTNAIRYTPKGGQIKLSWYLNNNEAVFSVADTGIGIDQIHLDRLTERFYRVDRSRSRETGRAARGARPRSAALRQAGCRLSLQGATRRACRIW